MEEEIVLDYLGTPNIMELLFLAVERGGVATEDSHREIPYCWLEEEEDGGKEPGVWMTSGSWESQGNVFHSTTIRKELKAHWNLDFSPERPLSDF